MSVRVVRTEDIAACRAIRHEVFIVEQQVPEADEWDDKDGEATHFLLMADAAEVGTGRVRILGDVAKLERIALRKAVRGKGYGDVLMQHLLEFSRAQPGITMAKLHGQVQALPFYEKQGFVPVSEEYLEAGIPHKIMMRAL